jgi:hypothetical protein
MTGILAFVMAKQLVIGAESRLVHTTHRHDDQGCLGLCVWSQPDRNILMGAMRARMMMTLPMRTGESVQMKGADLLAEHEVDGSWSSRCSTSNRLRAKQSPKKGQSLGMPKPLL